MSSPLWRPLDRLGAVGLGRSAIAIAILHVALVVSVAGFAAGAGPREHFAGDWQQLSAPGDDLLSQLTTPLQRWDALWYEHIASAGYGPSNGTTAFMPLFPALGSLVAGPLSSDAGVGLFLVAVGCYALALFLLARLAVHEAATLGAPDPTRFAILTMLGLAAFPTAFFLVAPFTESLFLALAVGTMLLARRGRLPAAAVVAGLASLVRVQGVFLAPVVAWEGLRSAGLLRGSDRASNRRRLGTAVTGLAAAAVPIIAVVAWYAALSVLFGHPTLGMSAQAPWGYELRAPSDAIAASLDYLADHGTRPLGLIEGLNLVSLIGFIGLVVAARRLPVSHALYAIPSLALVAARVMWFLPLMSVSRFVLVIFPGFLALGLLLSRHPRLAMAWLALSLAAQVALVQWFARWGFVA